MAKAEALAEKWQIGTDVLGVFLAHPTFEPTLMLPGNEEMLRRAFLECAPRSQKRWDAVMALELSQRPEKFRLLFVDKKKDTNVDGTAISKAEFAHALAETLVPGCGFQVPKHLVDAIRFIASTDSATAPSHA